MLRHDETFACMGTSCRVLIEDPLRDPAPAGAWVRRHLERCAAVLTRFDPSSELSRLNADPAGAVPVSALLHAALAGALWAAEATGGLVDPTLHAAIRRAGYVESLGATPAPGFSLREALAAAPARRRAAADPRAPWRAIRLEDARVVRPPGLTIDTGGTTKGLLADAVAHNLAGYASYVVDCGGDMRLGGRTPRDVLVADPFAPGESAASIRVARGAVATSGIGRRIWTADNGESAHHVLDPATGAPAWTGLVAVTALAPTALEAETLAKAALLSGPAAAPAAIGPGGGVLVHDDGTVEHVTPNEELLAA